MTKNGKEYWSVLLMSIGKDLNSCKPEICFPLGFNARKFWEG